jgi:hypothetical protein
MSIGAVPLTFFVIWFIGILTWAPDHRALIPIMDPLGMIGPFVLGFIFTATVGGTSAAWSWDLARAHPQSRSRVALALRLMTAALLITPFALLFLARFFRP